MAGIGDQHRLSELDDAELVEDAFLGIPSFQGIEESHLIFGRKMGQGIRVEHPLYEIEPTSLLVHHGLSPFSCPTHPVTPGQDCAGLRTRRT